MQPLLKVARQTENYLGLLCFNTHIKIYANKQANIKKSTDQLDIYLWYGQLKLILALEAAWSLSLLCFEVRT